MYVLKKLSSLFLILAFFSSCNSEIPDLDWPSAVPVKTPFVIIPAQSGIDAVLESSYIPFLEDITSSAVPLISQINSDNAFISVQAIFLYPGTNNKLQPI